MCQPFAVSSVSNSSMTRMDVGTASPSTSACRGAVLGYAAAALSASPTHSASPSHVGGVNGKSHCSDKAAPRTAVSVTCLPCFGDSSGSENGQPHGSHRPGRQTHKHRDLLHIQASIPAQLSLSSSSSSSASSSSPSSNTPESGDSVYVLTLAPPLTRFCPNRAFCVAGAPDFRPTSSASKGKR